MGEGGCLARGRPTFSFLPLSHWPSPVPERSHAAHRAAGRGSPGGVGANWGLGCRLQWRAAASRWNFLTNTRRRRPPLPRRREAGAPSGARPGRCAVPGRELRGGPPDCVRRARGVPSAGGEGNPEVPPQKPRSRAESRGASGVSRPASAAARTGSIPRRSP